ncbi:MAG: N-6 DNA methylase, partial [Streptococcaceae bacterium]|nr:N-6 DNA methylase [Streptococcaceae bacterium]
AEKYSEFGISNALNDTYFAFYALGLGKLLKSKGILGFIAPNTWKLIASARDFRKELLSSYQLVQIVDHVNKVFSDATVDVDTLIVKKDKPTKEIQILFMNFEVVEKSNFVRLSNLTKQEFINPYLTEDDYKLKEKIAKQSVFLKDELIIKNGVKPYEKGKGKPAQTAQIMAEKPFTSPIKGDDSFSPLIGGSSFQRYKLLWNDDNWIQYGDWLAAPREKAIFEAEEKLIFRQTSDSIIGTLIGKNYIMRNNTHIVLNKEGSDFGLKYVLALLNSKLTNWYYWTINPERGEAMAEVKAFHLGLLPLKKLPIIEQETLSNLTDKMLSVSTDRNKKRQQFLTRLTDNFELTKISKKLEKFDSLSFKEFLTELKKAKVSLSLKAQDEWSDYFEDYKADLSALTAELTATDAEIDRLVYQLYELTEEEVKIVEGEE